MKTRQFKHIKNIHKKILITEENKCCNIYCKISLIYMHIKVSVVGYFPLLRFNFAIPLRECKAYFPKIMESLQNDIIILLLKIGEICQIR